MAEIKKRKRHKVVLPEPPPIQRINPETGSYDVDAMEREYVPSGRIFFKDLEEMREKYKMLAMMKKRWPPATGHCSPQELTAIESFLLNTSRPDLKTWSQRVGYKDMASTNEIECAAMVVHRMSKSDCKTLLRVALKLSERIQREEIAKQRRRLLGINPA